ncbi:MAG: hypothetical protein FMNOHCHN_02710 [Ignavibacteriaceae bacterium]|nr:hypothetical protein [Ignavibacteriaceae bacterium]
MKNKLFNLIIGAVIALAIFSSVTTINYLREDKVLLATGNCPETYQACQEIIYLETEDGCWKLENDCCVRKNVGTPQQPTTCDGLYSNCLTLYCW